MSPTFSPYIFPSLFTFLSLPPRSSLYFLSFSPTHWSSFLTTFHSYFLTLYLPLLYNHLSVVLFLCSPSFSLLSFYPSSLTFPPLSLSFPLSLLPSTLYPYFYSLSPSLLLFPILSSLSLSHFSSIICLPLPIILLSFLSIICLPPFPSLFFLLVSFLHFHSLFLSIPPYLF